MYISNQLVLLVYIAINVIVFAMFVWDKHKARASKWRTPERTLIIASLFGPWGGTIGMKLAHHKTSKPKFKLVYLFLVLHIAIIAYLFGKGYI